MEKIRRSSDSIVKIEVNDDGDIIAIDLSDREFPNRFYALFANLQHRVEEFEGKRGEIENLSVPEQICTDIEMHKAVMVDIDNLFGAGTCKKVFGDIVPDVAEITDFFEQLVPILQKYGKKRQDSINQKYSPARKGGAR